MNFSKIGVMADVQKKDGDFEVLFGFCYVIIIILGFSIENSYENKFFITNLPGRTKILAILE